MISKISSKNQITIPKRIADALDLKKGDILEVEKKGNKIVMIPKEVIYKDKYPQEDLAAAEKVLSKDLSGEEVDFESGAAMTEYFRKRTKK